MKTFAALVLFLSALFHASIAQALMFDWAVIGNPGNPADTEDAYGGGYGSVAYSYRISKHEVSNIQYTEFLNAVAVTDTNSLYSPFMGSQRIGGITQSGLPGNFSYTVKADLVDPRDGLVTYGNKPVNYISFFDAMRFVNWLDNGQPVGIQGAGTTEDGVYTISDGVSELRNPNAIYFMPSEDEWHKAAFHQNDGITGNYWEYPTSTDVEPDANPPSSDTGNSANYDGPTVGTFLLTDVGAYTLSTSSYGTYDQGGNVWEWTEGVSSPDTRVLRGGSFSSGIIRKPRREIHAHPAVGGDAIGFRVARIVTIPEPNTFVLATIGLVGLVCRRRRRAWIYPVESLRLPLANGF